MPISLSGKKVDSIFNTFHLSGKNIESTNVCNAVPDDIQILKSNIIEIFILPFTLKKWSTFKENCFFIETFKAKIDFYYHRYKIKDILVYKDILTIIEFFNDQMVQLEDLEKKMYNPLQDGQFGAMIYKTTMIKLKTEYLLYDNILGKPLRSKNQSYNEHAIKDIQKMLVLNNVSYRKMQDSILSKYGMLVNDKDS
jgi:hypothetical protein